MEAFEEADLVCCEDTRRTGSLLKQIGVRVDELRRLDDHTEFESIPMILDRLVAGEQVVLVSDAGTPGISDPVNASSPPQSRWGSRSRPCPARLLRSLRL